MTETAAAAVRDLTIRMGKRVSKRSSLHGNASPVPGDVADGMLNGSAHAVRACETPEAFAAEGCVHGRSRHMGGGR